MAKSLVMALQRVAQRWYTSLPPRSINSWHQLKETLLLNFRGFCADPVTTQTLFSCKQHLLEPLHHYFRRFLNIKAQAVGIPDEVVIDAAINGLRIGQCAQYFARKRPRTVQDLFTKIEEFCRADNDLRLHQQDQGRDRRVKPVFEGPNQHQPHTVFNIEQGQNGQGYENSKSQFWRDEGSQQSFQRGGNP